MSVSECKYCRRSLPSELFYRTHLMYECVRKPTHLCNWCGTLRRVSSKRSSTHVVLPREVGVGSIRSRGRIVDELYDYYDHECLRFKWICDFCGETTEDEGYGNAYLDHIIKNCKKAGKLDKFRVVQIRNFWRLDAEDELSNKMEDVSCASESGGLPSLGKRR
jgi:hypothetical protein